MRRYNSLALVLRISIKTISDSKVVRRRPFARAEFSKIANRVQLICKISTRCGQFVDVGSIVS